jgi:hypothetical protein
MPSGGSVDGKKKGGCVKIHTLMAEPHPNLRKSIRILDTPLTQHEFKPFLKNNESFSLQYLSFQLPLPSKCYLQAECPTANTNRLANSLIAIFSVSV